MLFELISRNHSIGRGRKVAVSDNPGWNGLIVCGRPGTGEPPESVVAVAACAVVWIGLGEELSEFGIIFNRECGEGEGRVIRFGYGCGIGVAAVVVRFRYVSCGIGYLCDVPVIIVVVGDDRRTLSRYVVPVHFVIETGRSLGCIVVFDTGQPRARRVGGNRGVRKAGQAQNPVLDVRLAVFGMIVPLVSRLARLAVKVLVGHVAVIVVCYYGLDVPARSPALINCLVDLGELGPGYYSWNWFNCGVCPGRLLEYLAAAQKSWKSTAVPFSHRPDSIWSVRSARSGRFARQLQNREIPFRQRYVLPPHTSNS